MEGQAHDVQTRLFLFSLCKEA